VIKGGKSQKLHQFKKKSFFPPRKELTNSNSIEAKTFNQFL